jgi:putative aldouronate transport system substrate-binding protein
MKKSKLILILMCLVLVLGSLVACSSNNSSSKNSGNDQGQKQSNDKQDNNQDNKQAETPKEPLELSIVLTTGGSQYVINSPNINEDKYVKHFEGLANVDLDIELLPHENYDEAIALLLAGGDLPDILQTKGINQSQIAPAVDAGVLLPLNDLIKEHAPNLMAKLPKESWASSRVSKDGVIYGIPQENPIRNGTVVMMRKDWLDQAGKEEPTTVEEYIDVFRAFKELDPSYIPFSGREKFSHTYHFYGAYDVLPNTFDWTGEELIPSFIKPEMKDALETYRLLYEEKLFDQDVFTQPGQAWDQKITGQAIVGTWAHGAVWGDQWEGRLQASVPTAEITHPNAPVGPSGKPGAIYATGSSVSDFIWTIPQGSKDKAVEIIKFFDWYYSDDAPKNFFLYGIEGEDHTVAADGTVTYKYPETDVEYGEESQHQQWLKFTGPKYHQTDEDFIKGRKGGDLIMQGIKVSLEDGIINDGSDIPALPTIKARPELDHNGLFLEFSAKVITGRESVDNFDQFVADWRKRGGDAWIKEATEWYLEKESIAKKLPDWAQAN